MMKKDVKKSSLKSKLKLLIVTGLAIAAISTIILDFLPLLWYALCAISQGRNIHGKDHD